MTKFNVGYPTRTGNAEKDLANLYNFICELSDRLSYILNRLPDATENTEEQK